MVREKVKKEKSSNTVAYDGKFKTKVKKSIVQKAKDFKETIIIMRSK